MLLKKEFPLLIIIIIPFLYLAYLWNDLPETVPTHWNINGEIDGWSSKNTLLLIPFLLPVLIYTILTVIPKIDPKRKINANTKKYNSIKFFLTLFMSILALFIIYSSKTQNVTNPNIIILLMGLFFVIIGNYMNTFKPNYFIGIRTPWTLENETIWKETHKMAGKYWFFGGVFIIVSSLLFNRKLNATLFVITTSILTIIPIVYSYLLFKKQISKPKN